ncbi:hypothetical protein KJ966_19120 [bacterium]|nr:hypothetical protein [bacterium]
MKIENQVCSVDQAKRLVELGIRLQTFFQWELPVNTKRSDPDVFSLSVVSSIPGKKVISYPAPSVAELGELLPTVISLEEEDLFIQGSLGKRRGEFHYIWFQSSLDNVEWELFPAIEKDTEAEARAEALIWLIENDYVKLEDLREEAG